VLTEISIEGGPVATFSGRSRFSGVLTLHGVSRPVSGEVRIERLTRGARVEARFPISLPDYVIPKPRYLGVGVKDVVQARVTFEAANISP
jgi:hypothetical protein